MIKKIEKEIREFLKKNADVKIVKNTLAILMKDMTLMELIKIYSARKEMNGLGSVRKIYL